MVLAAPLRGAREADLEQRQRSRRHAVADEDRMAAAFGLRDEELEGPRAEPRQPARLRPARGGSLQADAVERGRVVAEHQAVLPAGTPPASVRPGLQLHAEHLGRERRALGSESLRGLAGRHRVEACTGLQHPLGRGQRAAAHGDARARGGVVAEPRQDLVTAAQTQGELALLLRAQGLLQLLARVGQGRRQRAGQCVERVLDRATRQRPVRQRQLEPRVVDQQLEPVARGRVGHPWHRGIGGGRGADGEQARQQGSTVCGRARHRTRRQRACPRAGRPPACEGQWPPTPPTRGPHDRPLRLPHHQEMARAAPRPHPALFAADAQRRQGLDHARGDRPALRAAPGAASTRNDQMSPEFLSLNPEQQDPGDPRSRRAGRQAAGAVRVGRDPDLPGRQDGPAHAARRRRRATRRSSG